MTDLDDLQQTIVEIIADNGDVDELIDFFTVGVCMPSTSEEEEGTYNLYIEGDRLIKDNLTRADVIAHVETFLSGYNLADDILGDCDNG